jgi:CDP-paratose 2-epimerase
MKNLRVLITGICGFVGSSLALELKRQIAGLEVFGIDNLSRPGSEQNRQFLQANGCHFFHGDVRNPSDLECLAPANWVIDAAANPSVLAGVTAQTSSRQLMEHNLIGTIHLLEYCKRHTAGLILLSTSRVYSSEKLARLPMDTGNDAFIPRLAGIQETGVSAQGINENFSTEPPLSLYGAAKLASEQVAREYGLAFDFPVQVNRCGVLAGGGQFGKPDQGIFSFWIHSYRQNKPLKYIGFGGSGHQVRDCLHPRDLASLLSQQIQHPKKPAKVLNVSGGPANSISLAQLTGWCAARFGTHAIGSESGGRRFDVPWLVLDSAAAATEWDWRPKISLEDILDEIACHAEQHPEWLGLSSGT